MIVIYDYIFKIYICKMGYALHKKARGLKCALRLKVPGGLCALVRKAPCTTMVEHHVM